MSFDLERTFDRCSVAVHDLAFSRSREWKELTGGKTVAFFPVYAPVELVHAAGMLPVGLSGAGDRLDIQHADARFGSFICSIVKTTAEMAMTNHLDIFDGVLFSTICDSARNLCFVLKRHAPDRYIDFLHLPQNCSSAAALEFLASEYRRLLGNLVALSGKPVDSESIRCSIQEYNRNRALVRELYEFRRRAPHQLAASELYVLVRAGNVLPVEEHTQLLKEVLTQLPGRAAKRRDSIRVVVEGSFCEQPPIELIQLLEAAGCYIVDDDFALQQNWFTGDVSTDGDPVLALAEAYLNASVYSSVRHDMRTPRWDALAEKVRRASADAVIFLIAKFCEPAYFDYVPFRQKLDETGTPHLLLEFEEKLFTFDRVRTEVETFVESLVFD
ncbi:MAG: 2-hydroxyacyl-CoA dehydratase [Terriglobales bacterium]